MRLLKIDAKENFLHLVPETEDDLWHLERVIEKHDLVSGSSDRKIKPKTEGEKAQRIRVYVTLDVASVEFHRFMGQLRVSGAIVDGKPAELLEMGAQQALEIAPGTEIKVKKKALKNFQVERLRKAAEATKKGVVMLVALDDEQASFAVLHEFELEEKGSVRSGKSGKQFKGEDVNAKYFSEVLAKMLEAKPEKAVVAGPGFAKEEFRKYLEGKGQPKGVQLFFASTNSVGKTGLQELVKGNALEKIVQEMQLVKETRLVEGLLAELGKGNGLAEYGLNEVLRAVEAGAVKQLIVSDAFFLEKRGESEKIMQEAEKRGAEVHLISGEHEAGKQLGSFGGIAALLRYKVK
jgi:protein pelota